MTKTLQHLKKHDREIAGIRKLLLQGGKMLVQIAAAQKRTDEAHARTERTLEKLSAAQARTEQTLERFIRSLTKGGIGNGHKAA